MITLPENYSWVDLNPEMEKALDLIQHTSCNLNIIGPAGSGKSTLLKLIQDNSILKGNKVVLASTGIASALVADKDIKSSTIHSFFKLPSLAIYSPSQVKIKSNLINVILNTDIIIIEEVSMVTSNFLDFICELLLTYKARKDAGLPRIILFGDIFQLPPVINRKEKYFQYYKDIYDGKIFYFNSMAFKDYGFKTIFLNKIYRQENTNFQNILNRIRLNEATQEDLDTINSRVMPEEDFFVEKEGEYTCLTTTNNSAQVINDAFLYTNPEPAFLYKGIIEGDFDISKNSMLQMEVVLKKNSKVIITKNGGTYPNNYQNGLIGDVTYLCPDFVSINTKDGNKTIQRDKWSNYDYIYNAETKEMEYKENSSFSQIACQLGYARTVHKSQGATLPSCYIDFEHFTPCSSVYVALSRVRKLEDIGLKRKITFSDIKVDQEALDFVKSL